MILRTHQISNNINQQLRKELSMAYRLIRRSILLNRMPPQQDAPSYSIGENLIRKILPTQERHEEMCDVRYPFPKKWIAIILLLISIGIVCLFSGCVMGQEIPDQKAIKAIIGEAENQGFEGLLAIAHAIRNRGNLKGVYGIHAPRVRHHLYSPEILREATQAWQQSAIDYDITHGSTGWGSIHDIQKFEMCRWWEHCVITVKIKDHIFYKEQK